MMQIKEVADLLGISVRMLHHYDKIGLVQPDGYTESGYRLYSDENLAKLQHVLFFKELDFKLEDIKNILNHQDFDQIKALESHKDILNEKIKRLEKIVQTVNETIYSIKGGIKMDKKKMFEAFDMKEIKEQQKKYQKEAEEKYGQTDAYKESQRRTSKYTKEDWAQITTEQAMLYTHLASLKSKDVSDDLVQEVVNELRNHITKYYYQCSLEMFKGLGQLYANDPRFAKNIDKYGEGLTEFYIKAIDYYYQKQKSQKA